MTDGGHIPSMLDIYAGFPFKKTELTFVAGQRPKGTDIEKLIKGFLRNGKSVRSKRIGCKGVGMGNKWQCMKATEWNDEQQDIADATYERDHDNWQARKATVEPTELTAWSTLPANREPLRTDDTYNIPNFPVIENPGELDIPPGTTAPMIATLTNSYNMRDARFQLETNVQQALKKLFCEMIPEEFFSDKFPDEDDVDITDVRSLLEHLDQKYNKLTAKERTRIHEEFQAPKGDLTLEKYFSRQLKCQKKVKNTKVPISDAMLKDRAIVHFNQIQWMQNSVKKWELEKDPEGIKSVAALKKFFIDEAGRYADNQAELREMGIVNHVDAAAKSDLAAARAEISELRRQLAKQETDILTVANAVVASRDTDDDSTPSDVTYQSNRVTTTDPSLQALLHKITQMESKMEGKFQSILNNSTNTRRPPARNGVSAYGPDCTGRKYILYCGNCGAKLENSSCARGCVKIRNGEKNLPFPTQAECDKVTFDNRHRYPGACQKNVQKWGQKWEDVTDPAIVKGVQGRK